MMASILLISSVNAVFAAPDAREMLQTAKSIWNDDKQISLIPEKFKERYKKGKHRQISLGSCEYQAQTFTAERGNIKTSTNKINKEGGYSVESGLVPVCMASIDVLSSSTPDDIKKLIFILEEKELSGVVTSLLQLYTDRYYTSGGRLDILNQVMIQKIFSDLFINSYTTTDNAEKNLLRDAMLSGDSKKALKIIRDVNYREKLAMLIDPSVEERANAHIKALRIFKSDTAIKNALRTDKLEPNTLAFGSSPSDPQLTLQQIQNKCIERFSANLIGKIEPNYFGDLCVGANKIASKLTLNDKRKFLYLISQNKQGQFDYDTLLEYISMYLFDSEKSSNPLIGFLADNRIQADQTPQYSKLISMLHDGKINEALSYIRSVPDSKIKAILNN